MGQTLSGAVTVFGQESYGLLLGMKLNCHTLLCIKKKVLYLYSILITNTMNTIFKKFEKKYGYKPTINELHTLYSMGSLILTDKEENTIIDYFEKNLTTN